MDSERFEFGNNWRNFLDTVDERRIEIAQESLRVFLEADSLEGHRFLDLGCGSGLFSLAARRLGALVTAFDYDPESVATSRELKRRFAPEDASWKIDQGSALDESWMDSLGEFDVVYSWGVLHHTGDMFRALDLASRRVRSGGRFFLSIYNDQGRWSQRWRWFKRTYNRIPSWLRLPYTFLVMGPRELAFLTYSCLKGKLGEYIRYHRDYATVSLRGMSYWHDLVDWIGGYPFEVACPEQIFDFLRARGFRLDRLKTCAGGLGCNEFVFTRTALNIGECAPAGTYNTVA